MNLERVVATLHDAPFRPTPKDLDTIAEALRLRRHGSDYVITWFDRPVVGLDSPSARQRLADVLYAHAYTLGRPAPMLPEPTPATRLRSPRLFTPDARLSPLSAGWTIVQFFDSALTLSKSGEPTLTVPSDVVKVSSDPHVVNVPVSAYSESRLPGFASVLHGAHLGRQLTRVYVNTTFDSVTEVAEQLVKGLLDLGIEGFFLKWSMTVDHDSRADSTVLYIDRTHALAGINTVQALELPLLSATPMFALRISAGLAIAADPGSAISFGQHACYAAAQDLIARLKGTAVGKTGSPPRTRVAGAGKRTHIHALSRVPRTIEQDQNQSTAYLLAQARILKEEAIWDGQRAGWLTCPPTSASTDLIAAGADVYSGAPGPILVLAHATRAFGTDEFRQLARAAANDVARRCTDLSSEGFHCGSAGTAAVLAEAAAVADDSVLLGSAEQVWEKARGRWRSGSTSWDLTHGHAGFALGMIVASKLLRCDCPREAKAALDRVIEIRGKQESGWRCAVGKGRRALTGLAHGCFGAALALHNGIEQFDAQHWHPIVVATLGFGLDRRCQITGRWLDRRVGGNHEEASWCHGAAGIGLACAAFAAEIPPASSAAAEAAAQLIQWLDHEDRRVGSLCHGRIGVILCLDQLGRQLNRADLIGHANAACRHTVPPSRWLSPSPRDRSLMTGTSGVTLGWFLAAHGLEPPLALTLREESMMSRGPIYEVKDLRVPESGAER